MPAPRKRKTKRETRVGWLEERSDDAPSRAPAVPGILPPGKIVEGEKAAGVYEGAEPPVLPLTGTISGARERCGRDRVSGKTWHG